MPRNSAIVRQRDRHAQDPPTSTPVRLNLLIPAETRDRLEQLRAALGASTLTQTIGHAITALEWIVNQREQGREVLVREKDQQPAVVHFVF